MANPNVSIKYTKIFIDNEFVDSVSGKKFPVENPATQKTLAEVAEGEKADIDKAVKAAKDAFYKNSTWRTMKPTERAALIYKLADLIDRDRETIAITESLENGKLLSATLVEVKSGADFLRYYAGWCDKVHGKTLPASNGVVTMTVKQPVGVAGLILPWNAPVILTAMKWGAALATGCTIVMKPAEQAPLCLLHLAALSKEAGFPPGVINVVPGYGPGAGVSLSEHPDVAKISFTGSLDVGKKIMISAGKSNLKRVKLELGGKSPLVVFDDADVAEAAKIAHDATFKNAGQICYSATRIFVQAKIYNAFVKEARELARNQVIGCPFDPKSRQGPQIDKQSFDRILKYIEIGKREGATLEVGGERLGNTGYFIKPTVFSNVTDDMTIAKEEIFGPVQSILKFHDIDEVVDRANKSIYGLAAGVISKDINRTMKFAQSVESGIVWVNQYGFPTSIAPFGGYKQSGVGRESGAEGLEAYLETKTIAIQLS